MKTHRLHFLLCHTAVVAQINGDQRVIHPVGTVLPVFTDRPVSPESILVQNFIRPQGQTVLIKNYPNLFSLYGHSFSRKTLSVPFWKRVCNLFGANFKAKTEVLCNTETEFVLPKI